MVRLSVKTKKGEAINMYMVVVRGSFEDPWLQEKEIKTAIKTLVAV